MSENATQPQREKNYLPSCISAIAFVGLFFTTPEHSWEPLVQSDNYALVDSLTRTSTKNLSARPASWATGQVARKFCLLSHPAMQQS